MRESKKGEKTHLPKGSTEDWLESQKPVPGGLKHKKPPEDSYEAWVEKRAEKSRGTGTKAKKTSLEIST